MFIKHESNRSGYKKYGYFAVGAALASAAYFTQSSQDIPQDDLTQLASTSDAFGTLATNFYTSGAGHTCAKFSKSVSEALDFEHNLKWDNEWNNHNQLFVRYSFDEFEKYQRAI